MPMLRPLPRLVSIAALFLASVNGPAAAQQAPQLAGPQVVPPANPQQFAAQDPTAARAPFTLTPAEEAYVDLVLKTWEDESGKIKTFKCSFEHLQYQATGSFFRQ